VNPALAAAISAAIDAAEGGRFVLREALPVAGGCIGRNLRIGDGGRRYFVKILSADADRVAAEIDGLRALAACPAIIVPRPVGWGVQGAESFLILEWLDFDSSADEHRLAEAIAALHAIEFPRYGWARDNYIGATPQANGFADDWATFFVDRRLRPQLALAAANGHSALALAGQALCEAVPAVLAGHRPPPSLLHGDLWSGNVAFVGGKPVLFDPAVHAGDGECDLAMAALFGGFGPRFFERYRALRAPAAGDFAWRRRLYQLYHQLNHANLFGGAWVREAAAAIDRLRERCR
jgi:protein-ribulosamine 3-kinase